MNDMVKKDSNVVKVEAEKPTPFTVADMRPDIRGKLLEQQATSLEDAELERVFRHVVVPDFCIDAARKAREAGVTIDDIRELENARSLPIVDSGRHLGEVVDVAKGYVVQNVGRGQLVLHDLKQLSQRPKAGNVMDVNYVEKAGEVKIMEQSKGVER